MAGYNSGFDIGREMVLEPRVDPGNAGTLDLGGRGMSVLTVTDASTDGVVLPAAPNGTVFILVNASAGNVTVSDAAGIVVTVADNASAICISTESTASQWRGQAVATHA